MRKYGHCGQPTVGCHPAGTFTGETGNATTLPNVWQVLGGLGSVEQDREQWLAVVTAVMNVGESNFLANLTTMSSIYATS